MCEGGSTAPLHSRPVRCDLAKFPIIYPDLRLDQKVATHPCTFLRNELCSNNLSDFGLKKCLEHLDAVRTKFLVITDRFAGLQAQWLNVHVDFPLLQRIALPLTIGSVYYAGIKIHETRITRLLEVLLHGGNCLGGWTARHMHQVVLGSSNFPKKPTTLTNSATTCENSKGTAYSNVTAHATPIA